MSDEQLNKILMKADSDLEALKDRCHDLYEENERLKEDNRKKTKRCTERNHRIRCRDRKLERRDKKVSNLQQENERLKERVAYLERSNNRREDTIIGLRFEVAEQEDYKTRCEKASEYNGKIIKALLTCSSYEKDKIEDMLYKQQNILQNGSEDNEC